MGERILGVERRGIPWQGHEEAMNYCAVLVQGSGKDCACYLGCGTPEWVAAHGDKITLKEAEAYFPWILADLVRMGLSYRGVR